MIFRCQPGYETHLEREIRPLGFVMSDSGGGWLEAIFTAISEPNSKLATRNEKLFNLCFARAIHPSPQIIAG